MVKGILHGTVTSGHPTRTTWGNTLRVWTMSEFFRRAAKIPEENMKALVAGDDTFVALSSQYVNRLKTVITHFTSQDTSAQIVGNGYTIREFKSHPHIIDFLSKTGWWSPLYTYITRKVQRVVLGGNYTNKTPKGVTAGCFNMGITLQLTSAMANYPII